MFSWVSDGCRKHGSDDEVDSSQIGGFGGIWYVSCGILVDLDMIYLLWDVYNNESIILMKLNAFAISFWGLSFSLDYSMLSLEYINGPISIETKPRFIDPKNPTQTYLHSNLTIHLELSENHGTSLKASIIMTLTQPSIIYNNSWMSMVPMMVY